MRALLAAAFLCLPGAAGAARFERGPYLENMAQDMVTVRFRADVSTPAWLSYGVVPDCERFLTSLAQAKEQKITLFGLMPDTTYCYRLYLPADQSTGVYKVFEGPFTTFGGDDKTQFSFLAFGDSGSGSQEQRDLAARMEKFHPDFVLHTGDMVESGLDSDADAQYFKPYAALLARTPFFLALGNHDYGADLRSQGGRGFIKANYAPFHSVPLTGLPPHYYFFDEGNARFFVLDTNAFDGARFAPTLEPGSKQYKWLEHYLAKTEKAWKFVVVHEPLYSTGAHGALEAELKALEPLLLRYKVDVVFQGHDHDYERTVPVKEGEPDEAEGIVYVTLAGGGSTLYIQRRNEPWSEKFLPTYHFAFIEVKDKDFSMTVYNKDGEVIDSLEIQK